MSTFRNKLALMTAALLLPLFALTASTGYAQDEPKEKAEKPSESRKIARPESGNDAPVDSRRRDRTFIPREKISAGKPVSFPTDI